MLPLALWGSGKSPVTVILSAAKNFALGVKARQSSSPPSALPDDRGFRSRLTPAHAALKGGPPCADFTYCSRLQRRFCARAAAARRASAKKTPVGDRRHNGRTSLSNGAVCNCSCGLQLPNRRSEIDSTAKCTTTTSPYS